LKPCLFFDIFVIKDEFGGDCAKGQKGEIFNSAAQHWNHSFFWKCLRPKGGGKPSGALAAAIDKKFGSYDAFRKEFEENATKNFGSGWTWLVTSKGVVEIENTSNAESPISTSERSPIVALDVWEHAYYIDQRNERKKFIEVFMDQVINWDFASKNFDAKK
jgi:superoxide dismutase, Fe-Mn family